MQFNKGARFERWLVHAFKARMWARDDARDRARARLSHRPHSTRPRIHKRLKERGLYRTIITTDEFAIKVVSGNTADILKCYYHPDDLRDMSYEHNALLSMLPKREDFDG